MNVWVVIDVGCYECGVLSEPVGIFLTEAEADTASDKRDAQTGGWRDGGQTACNVFQMSAPS